MSPVNRQITGAALMLSLDDEVRAIKVQLAAGKPRTARTLTRDGSLRAVIVGLGVGGVLSAHQADGPITVQVPEGAVEFEAEGTAWTLTPGTLFALDSGITHSVSAPAGGVFLLTVSIGASRERVDE